MRREPHAVCPVHGPYWDHTNYTNDDKRCPDCRKANDTAWEAMVDKYRRAVNRFEGWRQQIPPRHANRTLDNWSPEGRGQEAAKSIVSAYVERLPSQLEDGRGLLLLGPPGTGKTHLLCGIVSACWAQGIRAEYHVWPEVLSAVKDSFGGDKDHPARGLLDHLAGVRFLALDELAIRAGSDYDQAALFDVIDYRYRNLKPTICATNATEKTLPMIGERAVDRMRESMTFVQIPGASRRANASKDRALIDSRPALAMPDPITLDVQFCVNGEMQTVTRVHPNPKQQGVG